MGRRIRTSAQLGLRCFMIAGRRVVLGAKEMPRKSKSWPKKSNFGEISAELTSENWSPIKSLWEISHWVLWMGYVIAVLLCSCLYLVLKEVRHLSPWAFGLLKMQAQLRCSVWRCRMLAMIESNLWGGRCCLQQQVVQQRPSIAGFSGASSYCHFTGTEKQLIWCFDTNKVFLDLSIAGWVPRSLDTDLTCYDPDMLQRSSICPRSHFTMQSCGCWRILIETSYYICNWTNMLNQLHWRDETYFPVTVHCHCTATIGNGEGEVQLRQRKSRHDQSPLASALKSNAFPGWRKEDSEGLQGGKARRKEGQMIQVQNENAK